MVVSRAEAKKILRQQRVTVNGVAETKGDVQIDPALDTVCADGVRILYKQFLYVMQYKPAGVVSASSDGGTTVIDILPQALKRPGLFPAGRLDKDTTGFVLITDDGALAHDLLSPSHHVEKTYVVTLERKVSKAETDAICGGMVIGEERFKPARLRYLDKDNSQRPRYEIVLCEGRYHQIKRMFGAQGNAVCALKRTGFGSLTLDPSLSPGESRELTEEEISRLRFRQNI